MASTRLIFLAGILLIRGARLMASGGWFDEAPPTLDYYIQCLPAKSIGQILNTNALSTNTGIQSLVDQAQLTKDFEKGASPELVKKIDRLLVRARDVHASPIDINLMQDLRDLAQSAASRAEVSDYLKWRLDHLKWFTGPDDRVGYDDKPTLNPDYLAQLDAKISGSCRALLPHWLYLKGALYYKNLDDTNSETYFDRVLKEFPESPRAETALFMKARCRLSQSVDTSDYSARNSPKTAILEQAKQLFEEYLTKYPQGKYRNDVDGWMGGAAYRSGDFVGALPYFIKQTENKDHPEDFQPAITMIEKCLYHLRDTGSEDIDEIAKHPPIALALAYFAINSAGSHSDESDTDVANIQKWRREVLPKLAAGVLAEKKLYRGRLGQNRYLGILAHAASDKGNQDEALKIIRMGSDTDENDDFAYVKALVYQRSGKLDQAVAGYREFLKKFPSSPLVSGVVFRLALALHDQKNDGDALIALASIRDNKLPIHPTPRSEGEPYLSPAELGSSIDIDYSGASAPQIDQTMDALLNFAPIASLETALNGKDKEHEEFRKDLRDVLRERSLAVEDFTGAASFTDLPDARQHLLDLAKQVSDAKSSTGPQAANAMSQIGDYWASSAKLAVALPLDGADMRQYLFHDDSLAAPFFRKTNAKVLSLTNLDEALDSRDEWTHAISWWTNSVQSDQTNAIAPTLLWKAIQAERKIVEISPYTQQRAAETDRMAVVCKEYETLVNGYPDSEEVKKYALFWNFPTWEELKKIDANAQRTLLYRYARWDQANLLAALGNNSDANYNYPPDQSWSDVCKDIANLPEASKSMDAKAFELKVDSLLSSAVAMAKTMARMPVINFLQDSKQLSQVPSLDPSIREEYLRYRVGILQNSILTDLGGAEYVRIRERGEPDRSDANLNKNISELAKKPGAQPIVDFIDFLPVAITANHLNDIPTGLKQDGDEIVDSERNYPLLAAQAAEFLKKYPVSPKREAAMVLRLRGLALAALPTKFFNTLPWPEANSWAGDPDPLFYKQAPFDEDAFNKSLKAYYAEFPKGIYPNAILSYRADVALIKGQWSDLLDDLLTLHNQKNAPEFQEQIAIELSVLFNKLDDENLRLPILQEILKRPTARKLLSSYLDAGGIPYLKDYLRERIAKS